MLGFGGDPCGTRLVLVYSSGVRRALRDGNRKKKKSKQNTKKIKGKKKIEKKCKGLFKTTFFGSGKLKTLKPTFCASGVASNRPLLVLYSTSGANQESYHDGYIVGHAIKNATVPTRPLHLFFSFFLLVLMGRFPVSLLYLLMQTSRPANSILGRLPQTREYRNVRRFPMAKEIPGIRIFRFDSSLHFANKDYFENRLKALVRAAECGAVRWIGILFFVCLSCIVSLEIFWK